MNAGEKFLDDVLSLVHELRELLRIKIDMEFGENEKLQHNAAHECYLCKKPFGRRGKMGKVRDHDHLTGKYRGAAHSICNLQLRINPITVKIPVVFHNLKGYDAHLILSSVKKEHEPIKVIANNSEKYVSFQIRDVVFIDSMQFMSSSLEKLASNLPKEKFNYVKRFLEYRTTRADDENLLSDENILQQNVEEWERIRIDTTTTSTDEENENIINEERHELEEEVRT